MIPFFILEERSDLQDENIFVLQLDLLERSTHGEKTRTAIEHFGGVSLSTTGSRAPFNSKIVTNDILPSNLLDAIICWRFRLDFFRSISSSTMAGEASAPCSQTPVWKYTGPWWSSTSSAQFPSPSRRWLIWRRSSSALGPSSPSAALWGWLGRRWEPDTPPPNTRSRCLCCGFSTVLREGSPNTLILTAALRCPQGFFNSLRPELADYPNIHVSTVCPGPVISKIVQNAFTEEVNKVRFSLWT